MPLQLRPVRERESNIPAILNNPNSLLMPQSIMQTMFLGNPSETLTKESKGSKNFDMKSKDILFQIWASRDEKIIEAQKMLRTSEILFKVPSVVSGYDVMKLVTEGLLVNKGNNHVAFTDRGKMALGMKIMEQPSEFEKKKTKEKFVFSQVGGSNFSIDPTQVTPDMVSQLKTMFPDLPEEFIQANLEELATQAGLTNPQAVASESFPNLQNYMQDAAPVASGAQG